jgi:hypothetical protein
MGRCPLHSALCVEAIPVRARIQIAAKFVLPGLRLRENVSLHSVQALPRVVTKTTIEAAVHKMNGRVHK